ncbi:MAG: glycosyltransferase family 2 protein [Candidatus Margulisbacteria bacterium]|nr:glycosyltransferase family 2 protein [Candidatus Margulisiibacteriota bacterium]
MQPDISIVILCYHASHGIVPFVEKVVQEIEKHTKNWEIILVGNYLKGSADDTPEIVRNLAQKDPRFIALTLEKKGMMGWDARSGLEKAIGKTIALIDGDGQMPPEDLSKVYSKLIDENLDMVKTYREQRYDGIFRKINSEVYNVVFKILFPGFKVRDVNSKPKIFTQEFFKKLKLTSNDWFLDAEIMIQARRYRCKLGEVSTIFYESQSRKSFIKVKHILEFLKNFLIARIKEFFINK